jgi:hypothetical protein
MRRIRTMKIAIIAAAVIASLVGTASAASAASAVSAVTVAASPFANGASATYTIEFRTSLTGALINGSSTITLSGLNGTFPTSAGAYSIDAQAHSGVASAISGGGSSVTLTMPTLVAAAANTIVTVTATGVTNPAAANYTANVNTSVDATPTASSPYTIGAATILNTSGGDKQSVPVSTAFPIHLGASLKNGTTPVLEGGVQVVFTAVPGLTGASGTFANGTATTTATTGSTGVATATPLTANGIVGVFTVTASVPSLVTLPLATFTETNLAQGVPGAPTGVSATAGDASAAVSWVAPASNGGSAILGYTVTSSPGGITATAGASATSVVVPGLSDGTTYTFMVTATNGVGGGATSAPSNAVTPTVAAPPSSPSAQHGYWLVGGDGGIFTFGSALFHGSTGSLPLSRPVVGITPTASRQGYWLDAADGGIFAFGDAGFYGSIPGLGILPAGSAAPGRKLAAPVVGMVPSADGGGYFMVASDGGVFAFGDAVFAGSCPAIGGCAGPAVAVMPDHTGNGYWLVTATGNIYGFGDAPFLGAPGNLGSPVTSAVRTSDGNGYWILFANGTVRGFGDAANLGGPTGSAGGLNPASAIFATATGGGYWVAQADGTVSTYGDAPNDGGMNGMHLNKPIIAGTGW